MEEITKIIEAFGGVTKMARALGHKHPTTVHSWKTRGNIPAWRWHEIKQAAKKSGIADHLADLEKK